MLVLVVTSRFISPNIYGEFALINATHLIFFPLIDSGFSRAYLKTNIRSPELDNIYFSAYFFMLLIYIILFVLAVIILFGFTSIKYSIFFVVSAIFAMLSQQRINILAKTLREDSLFLVNTISISLSGLLTLWFAINDYGIYALLAQPLMFQLTRYILSKLIAKSDFKFIGFTVLRIYKNDFRFGFQILASRIITAYATGLDKIILSIAYPMSVIGLYSRAFELVRLPNRTIGVGLSSPILAYFSSLLPDESKRLYPSTFELLLHVSVFPLIVLVLWAEYLIPFVLGDDWYSVTPYVLPLSIWGIGKILHGFLLLIYTNEKAVKGFLTITFLGFSLPLLSLLIMVLKNVDIFDSLFVYSIMYLFIWIVFLIYSMRRFGFALSVMRTILPIFLFIITGSFTRNMANDLLMNGLLVMLVYFMSIAAIYYKVFIARGLYQNELFKK